MSHIDASFDLTRYHDVFQCKHFHDRLRLQDHLGGFRHDLTNAVLDHVHQHSSGPIEVCTNFKFANNKIPHYPRFRFTGHDAFTNDWGFAQYCIHPDLDYKNFLCSFNGSAHVSRKLLVSALQRMGWFNSNYCSKNFEYTTNILDGHLTDLLDPLQTRLYRKFFVAADSEEFFRTRNGFGHVRFEHAKNIYNLEHRITQSFLHIVSETMATSYYPFVTEKFLYSIITRGLFLAYGQPGWHDHLERYYGFRRYTRLFDYRFDSIQNPVERLVELMSMIAKFSVLSPDDWHDLYEMESETVEYNYDHYFSKNCIKHLEQFV